MQYLESTQNAQVKQMRALRMAKARRESGCFLVEGVKLCGEALSCGLEISCLFVEKGFENDAQIAPLSAAARQSFVVSRRVLENVCETKTPQPVVLSARFPAERKLAFPQVALDGVQDPGNLGAILRTCDAAGFCAVLGEGSADPYSPKAVRAAMGSVFRVPFLRHVDLPAYLENARKGGAEVIVSALDGSNFFEREPLPQDTILVIGSEGQGVSPAVRKTASHVYKLPMRGGAESLNASVAAGILIYELYRGMIVNEL